MRVLLRIAVAGAVLLAALGARAGPAFAHARLLRSQPADRAVLAAPPRAVSLFFDDTVVPTSGIRAVRNGGGSVLAGLAHLAPGTRRELVIPLRARLPVGDYSVRWRIVSDDGHLIAGVLAFAVGSGRAPPTPSLTAGGTTPSARDVFARWLFFAGLLLASGSAAFALAVWRPALRAEGLRELEHGRFSALLVAGSVLVVVGGWSELHTVSSATRFGIATSVGVFGAAGIAALAAIAYVEQRLRAVAQIAALPLVLVPTTAGHALDPGRSWIEPVADALHITAAAVWFGGLVALFAIVPRVARSHPAFAARVVRRFSAIALGAVAVLSLTGLIRALSELAAFHQLWTIGYGRAILVKTGLLAALLVLAWLNRYRLVPRLPERRAATRLRETAGAEVALFIGLVVAVAVLTQLRPGRAALASPPTPSAGASVNLEPPPPPPAGAFVLARRAGSLAVALAIEPGVRPRLTATVLGQSGGGLSGLSLSFRLKPGSGPSLPTHPCGRGCYQALAPPGARSRVIEVQLRGGASAVFTLPARWPAPSASALVDRATRVFRDLRSLVFVESLSSGPGSGLLTTWRLAAPNRVAYEIRGGASAVVIGERRWDQNRPGGPWTRSQQLPALRVPQPTWDNRVVDAHLLGTGRVAGRRVWIVSFADPQIPAWFTVWIDRRTYRTLRLRMTAAAHFMFQRYKWFDRPLRISPPR